MFAKACAWLLQWFEPIDPLPCWPQDEAGAHDIRVEELQRAASRLPPPHSYRVGYVYEISVPRYRSLWYPGEPLDDMTVECQRIYFRCQAFGYNDHRWKEWVLEVAP